MANLSLLGYRPEKYYTGRAPLEAAAMGVKLAGDETAFRCNLVTLNRNGKDKVRMLDYSAGHISSEESHQLIAALEEACSTDRFHFKAGISYRHILVVRGAYPVLDTVPPHDYIEKDVSEPWQRYMSAPEWQELLEGAHHVLKEHPVNRKRIADGKNPANGIWLWGEGKLPAVPSLFDRFGLQGSLISAVDLLKGLAVNVGLEVINIPGATGYIDTNYRGKAEAALECLKRQDYVFVHVEAPDEAGHQGILQDKIQAIEDFDAKIVAPILRGLEERKETFRMVATMDHYTPSPCAPTSTDPFPLSSTTPGRKSREAASIFQKKMETSAAWKREEPSLTEKP